jgi:MarR family transcriptional regulator for hemolysin
MRSKAQGRAASGGQDDMRGKASAAPGEPETAAVAPPASAAPGQEFSFMRDVSLITRRMRIYAERSMAHRGLGFPEQVVIMHLAAHGRSNQEQVARQFGIDKGAIAKTAVKLEEKGLITRTVNPQNKREKLMELTPAANDVVADMQRALADMAATMFSGMSADEVARLTQALSRVAANLSGEEGDER